MEDDLIFKKRRDDRIHMIDWILLHEWFSAPKIY